MATTDYHHGEMDIQSQENTWHGFLVASTWGGLIVILSVAYATFAVAIGMDWMVSLGICAVIGFAAGFLLNLGGRWIATMVAMIALALIIQGFIALFSVFLS